MERYRIGIVGTGFGVSAHLPALVAHPRFEVVALASPTRAAGIAAERNIPHAFSSIREMLAGCELDAVTVAAPPFVHLDDVLASLSAEKHVICEKPFALNVAGAERMVEASHAAGTACGVSHEFRFVPEVQALRQLVANHHLEPLREIEATSLRQRLRANALVPRSWWFEHKRGGGLAGAMLSHMIDQATWLAGRKPVRCSGFVRTANPVRHDEAGTFESTSDDGAFALMDYGDGLVARVSADDTTAVNSYTCAVHAENRTAVASGEHLTGMTLYSIDGEETNELQCKPSPYARYANINSSVPLLMELYDEFVKKIEGQPNELPTFDEALVTQEVLASIGYGPA
jgi:predicted dehydrogenase